MNCAKLGSCVKLSTSSQETLVVVKPKDRKDRES